MATWPGSAGRRAGRRPAEHPHIAVVGPGTAGPETLARAHAVGRELGARGCVVVCGGLGGAMESACRGAKAVGATTIGILPGPDRKAANAWVDIAVPTGLGEARNALVVHAADALVAVGGEWGTLSEIALAMKLGRPVVGLDTWELARRGRAVEALERASSPEEAADRVLDLVRARRR